MARATQSERLVAWSHLSSPQIAPRWCGERGEEGHNGRWTPSKRMFCKRWERRWERRWGWCEGSRVLGDRFASGDSSIHLSLTLTPGARGEQSAFGQGEYDPSLQTHTVSWRKYRSRQRGSLKLGSPSRPRCCGVPVSELKFSTEAFRVY